MLPLNPSAHVGVIGEAANKISSQTGGWTITWQGRENKNSDFVNTKTIYQSIVDVVTSAGGTIEFSKDGNFINSPDYVIGIFGEEPYAEMLGDLKDVSFSATDPSYLPSLQALKAQEIPVVSLFLSGRPLEVNQYINASEAFVATWLPGTAVEGISDVIFLQDDEIGFDFKGKLSYSWPKSKAQSLLNAHHDLYEPLFPFGYGLDYRSQVNLPDIAIVKVNQKIDLVNIFLGAAAIPGQEFILSKTGPEFVSSDEFISQDGKISISRFDYLRQDDAKNFLFNKSESMQGFGVSTKSPLDITSMQSPHYELIMRINDSEKEPLYFNVTCGQNCQGTVKLPPMDLDTWNTVSVPVSCLEKDGLDTSTIQIRALFLTKGLINFDLHSVAIKSGATTINIPDTVGYTIPSEFTTIIETLKNKVPNIDKAILSVHCHNDLGLAVANSLAGVQAGARQIECTINGLGERAGNAALEEVVMAIKTRPDLLPYDTGINTTLLSKASKIVSNATGFPVQYNKAIVGKNAFAHEAGIHQDGMLKNRQTYEIMTPESVGVKQTSLVMGKHSGRHAFKDKMNSLGYPDLTDDVVSNAFAKFKVLADKKKHVYDEDIIALVDDSLIVDNKVNAISLKSLKVFAGTGEPQKADMTLDVYGDIKQASETGDGPVDAIFKCIKTLYPHDVNLQLYQVHAVTEGTDAQATVSVKIEEKGKTTVGQAADTDTLVASANAYINALNKMIIKRDKTAPMEQENQKVRGI